DWSVSSNLSIGEWFVAFVFPSTTHREPRSLGCNLARRTGHRGIVMIGLDAIEKQSIATAVLYSVKTCQVARAAHVMLGTAETQKKLAALALFIVKGVRDPDVLFPGENPYVVRDLEGPDPEATARVADSPGAAQGHRSPGLGKWFAAGGSATSLALGGYGLYR